MKSDARAMEKAGACAIVLELLTPEAGSEVTAALNIPTIGIGAGKGTTGQIRVTYDLLGLTPWNRPGFVKRIWASPSRSEKWWKELRGAGAASLDKGANCQNDVK